MTRITKVFAKSLDKDGKDTLAAIQEEINAIREEMEGPHTETVLGLLHSIDPRIGRERTINGKKMLFLGSVPETELISWYYYRCKPNEISPIEVESSVEACGAIAPNMDLATADKIRTGVLGAGWKILYESNTRDGDYDWAIHTRIGVNADMFMVMVNSHKPYYPAVSVARMRLHDKQWCRKNLCIDTISKDMGGIKLDNSKIPALKDKLKQWLESE